MRKYSVALITIGVAIFLVACGGGDGPSFERERPTLGYRLSVTPDSPSMPAHPARNPIYPEDTPFATRVVVRVARSNGGVPEDGTTVRLRATPANLGMLSAAPGVTLDAGEGERPISAFIPTSSTLSLPLQDGRAEFYLHSGRQTGTVTLEASFTASSNGSSDTLTQAASVQLQSTSMAPLEAVTFITPRTRLPKNPIENYVPFVGAPYTNSVVVRARQLNGEPMFNTDDIDVCDGEGLLIEAKVPGDGVLRLSKPNSTDPDCEIDFFRGFFLNLPNFFGAAGRAQYFVHSRDRAGSADLIVSYMDIDTGKIIEDSIAFEVIDGGANGLPADISFSQDEGGLYVEGSGGRSSKSISVSVVDGGNQGVLDPSNGSGDPLFNNLKIEILDNGGASDARLFANSASGETQSGSTVHTFTENGQASFSIRSGSRTGSLSLRVTADGLDNNVDNGISDPVSATTEVLISDGQLFSLTFTDPGLVTINQVPGETGDGSRDGTYGLRLSVQANDRLGNPVIPGTNVQFGLVDYPLVDGSYPAGGAGVFALSGGDGNPEEAGFTFTAPNGAFINDPDGQVEPGDSILLDGQNVEGNRDADLTLQRIVSSVTGNQSLRVERRFNPNDGTGAMRDSGPVIPYIIGRARHGAIEATAQTDERGVASVKMNYPVSQINRRVAVWAQSEGSTFSVGGSNFTRTVGDITIERYYSAGVTTIVASPERIPASGTSLVSVCVFDEIGAPIPGATIGFSVSGGSGSVSIDGQVGSGTVANATGFDGCTLAEVTPTGQTPGSGETTIQFSTTGVQEPAEVIVTEITTAILQVIPSALRGNTTRDITLRLLDSSGQPLAGVQLTGACTVGGDGFAEILTPPGTTDENGETIARIRVSGMQICGAPPSGQCTFTTASGTPEGTLDLQGINLLEANFSPDPCA